MFHLFLLSLLFSCTFSQEQKPSPLVFIDVLLFNDAFERGRSGCIVGKVALYNREKLTSVNIVQFHKSPKKEECSCYTKAVNVIQMDEADQHLYKYAERFYLGHFQNHLSTLYYPDVICLPEYRCIVTLRPENQHFPTIQQMVDEIEVGADVTFCTDMDDHRGDIREHSTNCLYLEDKNLCRPPQSHLEKVVRDQREWFELRQLGLIQKEFIFESAVQ